MPPKLELVRDWFQLARADLEAARHLLQHDPPFARSACFHLQQTVEKALKGILILNDQRPPRIHDLADLFGLCERWLPGIAEHEADCAWLTKGAVEFRYPDVEAEITLDSANQGLKAAEAMLQYVLGKMPAEVRP
jgi:HEPN domain-containing protein